jgi:oligopeptide/dipeptide ABC transporter ATP-binding protein
VPPEQPSGFFGEERARVKVTSPAPVLAISDLSVRFPVRRDLAQVVGGTPKLSVVAVDGVSLAVSAGELVALVGESGSGKTTLAQAALGLIHTDAGSSQLRDINVLRASRRSLRRARRLAQFVYQDPYEALDTHLTVGQIVGEPLAIHHVGSRVDRRRLVVGALERVELTPAEQYLNRYPHELSGGQRQRVAVAAALVLEPKLLVADEPVSMLDVSLRAGVLQLLGRLRDQGLAVLMITHDLATAATYADRIAVMYLGRIVEEGPAAMVIQDPRHPYTHALLSAVPRLFSDSDSEMPPLRGEIPDPLHIPAGCRFHTRCPVAFNRCAEVDPQPERVGANHVAACFLAADPKWR